MVNLKISNIFENLDEFENRLLSLNGTKFEYLLDDVFNPNSLTFMEFIATLIDNFDILCRAKILDYSLTERLNILEALDKSELVKGSKLFSNVVEEIFKMLDTPQNRKNYLNIELAASQQILQQQYA